MPGTWEVRLTDIADTQTFDWEQAKDDEPVPPTKVTLKVAALSTRVSVVQSGDLVATGGSVSDNGHSPSTGTHQVWITNRMAEFEGAAVSTPVGSARVEQRSIAAREQQVFETEVLPGSDALLVRVKAEDGADLDVYVFDCTGDKCEAAAADGDPVGAESVTVKDPAAGTWKIVVDAAEVPEGEVRYAYLDVVLNPAYGMVSAVDMPQERTSGARWMSTAHSWIAPAAHEPGRTPYLAVLVEGTLQGSSYWVGLGTVR